MGDPHVATELGRDPARPRLDPEGSFAGCKLVLVAVLRGRENALLRAAARQHHHLRAGLRETIPAHPSDVLPPSGLDPNTNVGLLGLLDRGPCTVSQLAGYTYLSI